MLQHILKIIWKERKTNLWIILEYVLIFCVLWFCCDYISSIYQTYKSNPGFDYSDTYQIKVQQKPGGDYDRYGIAMTFLDRIKRHRNVEAVTIGMGMPYGNYNMQVAVSVNEDAISYPVHKASVTPEFFDVFKIPIVSGKIFDWPYEGENPPVVLTAYKNDYFDGGWSENTSIPMSHIKYLVEPQETDSIVMNIVGTTGRIIDTYRLDNGMVSTAYVPLFRSDVNLGRNQIVVRVKPGTDKFFPERFREEVAEQLSIDPYYLASIESMNSVRNAMAENVGITGKLNSTYSVTIFLIINVFIGILGTFWFRVQVRKSEIGLRRAIGVSKSRISIMMISETLILLSISSVIGLGICLILSAGGVIEALNVPMIDRNVWKIGWTQDLLNFIVTFGFLTILSIGAVLYPALSAASTQPVDVLRSE
ncbi:MAG: FtsX-like permease family protein [Rikenellaceae bacterium]|nr:FtsX-like permease family protein [Rikenellaceae bacterium]